MTCAESARGHTGGSPPSSWIGLRAVGARGQSPTPSCLHGVCARCWGGGGPSSSWSLSPGGFPWWCDWEFPPVPLLHAVDAHCGVGVPPPPSPPLRPLALGAGVRSGGRLISVRPPSGSCTLRACWDLPSGSCSPLHGGVSRCCARGSPPNTSLCAMSVRCWVGFPPPPPPPRRPLSLGARDRSGGPLPSISPSSGSRCKLALRGFCTPPHPVGVLHCVVWPHGRPILPQAPHWLGLPPTPPTPPCRNHGAGACRFQS